MLSFLFTLLIVANMHDNTVSFQEEFIPLFSFEKEVLLLSQQNPKVLKKIEKDGVLKESTTTINWEKELQFFIEAEVNFEKYQDQYIIKTKEEQGNKIITYTSDLENIKAKEVQYIFHKNVCKKIYIKRSFSTFMTSSIQEMYFEPKKGYEISVKEKIIGVGNSEYTISGSFIN